MSWETLKSSGSGKIALYLQIEGLKNVFSTSSLTPSDSWYTSENYSSVKQWLIAENLTLSERSRFKEGSLEVETLTLKIGDPSGAFTSLLKSYSQRNSTRLTITLDESYTTSMTVYSTSNFDSSGVVWVGSEAIAYTSKTSTTFLGLTRGYYGTRDQKHPVDLDAEPAPVMPVVADGPEVLEGRRANLYAGTVDNGTLSATECLYRGFVASDIKASGGAYELNLDHISKLWSRKVGADLPEASLRPGYYYSGASTSTSLAPDSTSLVRVLEHNVSTGAELLAEVIVSENFYGSKFALAEEWNTEAITEFSSVGFTRDSLRILNIDDKMTLHCNSSTSYSLLIVVRKGDPLWSLGFDEGSYYIPPDGNTFQREADNDPKPLVIEVPSPTVTSTNPYCETWEESDLVEETYAHVPDNPIIKIDSVSGTTVTFHNSTLDPYRRKHRFICVEDEDNLKISNCFGFLGTTLKNVIKKLFYIYSGQTEPERWCVRGLTTSDIDWDTYDEAMIGIPNELQYFNDAIIKETSVDEMICDRLGLIGIAPYITNDDAKIGFKRLTAPIKAKAVTPTIDSEIWEFYSAKDVETRVEGEPIINQIRTKHTYNYVEDKWADGEVKVTHSPAVISLSKIRYKQYNARGLTVGNPASPFDFDLPTDLAQSIARISLGSHFVIYGTNAPVISIPCTWKAKQIVIGDIVNLTHPVAVDITHGTVGITSRYGVVIGRRQAITGKEYDELIVQLPPENRGGIIAPCALGTSWSGATKKLTFSDTGLFATTGETDLTHFEVGMTVSFTEYDTTSPASYSKATISSVGSNYVYLDSTPWGSFPTSGVLMHYPAWDDSDSEQQDWIYISDYEPSLGTDKDAGYEWSI